MAAAPGWEFIFSTRREATPEQWQSADVILGSPLKAGYRETLADLPNLKWVQLDSSGVNQYADPGLLPPGCQLTCATGVFGEVIGEYLLAVTMLLQRRFHQYRDHQNAGVWHPEAPPKNLLESTVLVVGSGDIGTAYARRVKAMGAYTIGVRRSRPEKGPELDEVHLTSQLDGLLPRADVIALSLPDTPETRGIIDRRRLGLMKPDAIILNVGRGTAINTEALCDALEAGAIGGAGLDVTDPEPLPEGHRLWSCPNAFITPHIAGYAAGNGRKAEFFARNLSAYVAGEPLESMVDVSTGYRKG